MMNKFKQTFGGEGSDECPFDAYGLEIGDVLIDNITGEEFSKLVVAGMNHLMLNGHTFEFYRGEIRCSGTAN